MGEQKFADFLKMAIDATKSRNGIFYHGCCGSWTTRKAYHKRATHSANLPLGKFLPHKKVAPEEKEHQLKEQIMESLKYTEETIVKVNIKCPNYEPVASQSEVQPKLASEIHQTAQQIYQIEHGFSGYNIAHQDTTVSEHIHTSGRNLINKILLCKG
jgi:hypothetical protein